MTNEQAPMANAPMLELSMVIGIWTLVIPSLALVHSDASIYDVSFPPSPLAPGGGPAFCGKPRTSWPSRPNRRERN